MKDRYRIIVWGPGTLGRIAIRTIAEKAEFELVGVRCYSDSKHGTDAGDLAGIKPLGVIASNNEDEILKLDADVVIHTARDSAVYEANAEILRILKSGKNVVTILPYQHLDFVGESCPPGFPAEIQRACEEYGTVFHSTGLHPEMITERLAAAATGLCVDVKSIKLEENWDVSHMMGDTLALAGFGKSLKAAKDNPTVEYATQNYCKQNLYGLAKALGITYDRVEVEPNYVTAPYDLEFESMSVGQGTIARLSHCWKGYVDAINPEVPFATIEINWMMGHGPMLPEGMTEDDLYIVTIEGTPSVKLKIGIKESWETMQRRMIPDDPTSEAGFYSVIATMLQAVPFVCSSEPGVLKVDMPKLHWSTDFRTLAE